MRLIDDHNAARWLVVRWLEATPADHRHFAHVAGWYVVRICPCHFGKLVTHPRESRAAAERSRRAMLRVAA